MPAIVVMLAVVAAVDFPAGARRAESAAVPAYIAIPGAEWLTRPARLDGHAPGAHARMKRLRWRGWGTQKAVARGRARLCLTMGSCRRVRVRVTAGRSQVVTCGRNGPRLRFYSRVVGRVRLGGRAVRLVVSTIAPEAVCP